MTDCKIWRLERKGFRGIRSYLDKLIKEHPSWGNRKLASKLREKFTVDVSREAVRAYRKLQNKMEESVVAQENMEASYHICVKPLHKLNRADWKDKKILRALSE